MGMHGERTLALLLHRVDAAPELPERGEHGPEPPHAEPCPPPASHIYSRARAKPCGGLVRREDEHVKNKSCCCRGRRAGAGQVVWCGHWSWSVSAVVPVYMSAGEVTRRSCLWLALHLGKASHTVLSSFRWVPSERVLPLPLPLPQPQRTPLPHNHATAPAERPKPRAPAART